MRLIIPKEVEARIHDYVMSVDSEIAGMGRVTVDGDDITVHEVMIYEQDVTGSTADLSPQAMAKWQTELVRAGGSPKEWRLWWHSHHTMSAFFSQRDTGTIDAQTESDWIVSLVVNTKRERKARLDTYRPFRMYMDDIDIEVEYQSVYSVPEDIAQEVALKVKTVTRTSVGFRSSEDSGYKHIGDYTKVHLVSLVKTLENQLDTMTKMGQADSAEYMEVADELVGKYRQLATRETDYAIAAGLDAKADRLESYIYALDGMDI